MAAAAAKASNSIRATSTTTVFDAAYDGNLPAVRAFLDTTPEQQPTPVSLSRDDDLRTPLHWACSGSAVEVIEWLLKHGADANAADDSQWTPLIIAASVGSVPAIELLLAHGANVNASTETGATALHYAVSKNYPAAVRVLLDAGALPNVANRHGQLPIHRAASLGHIGLVTTLHLAKSKINTGDSLGNTPLHLACEECHGPVVQYLVQTAHADPDRRNLDGKIPLQICGEPTFRLWVERTLGLEE